MIKTLTVKQLIGRLENEDPDALVVFTSNYGDHGRTEQVHFIKGRFQEQELRKSAYSESGYAIADLDVDEDRLNEGPEVLVIS